MRCGVLLAMLRWYHLCGNVVLRCEEVSMTEQVHIHALAYGGDGIGTLDDGRTVFVPGTCPGDVAAVRVTQSKERFAKGCVDELVEVSPLRVASPCAEAATGRCGGCPWAHVAYEEQLRWKRASVVDALVRIGHFDEERVEKLVGACVPSKRQWHYRNKVEFVAGQDVAGRFALGAHAHAGAFDPLPACRLVPKAYAKAPKAFTGALRHLQGTGDLGIERVGLRVSQRTGDVEVALWTRTGRFPRAMASRILTDALPVKRPGITRVLLKGEAKTRKVSGVESLAGKGSWAEELCGRTMRFSAPSFFQVNTAGAEALVNLVMDGLQVDGSDLVLDLYAGAGTFTLPLAEAAHGVVAIEAYGSSVRDLRRNLEMNGLYAEVIGGDVAHELPELEYVDALVVDPPRAGLAPAALDAIVATGARRVAYVSCDPTTLARDLAKLTESAYRLTKLTPVDLFPQSYHVESVALLEKR